MARRPRVAVFDVVQTLMSLEPLRTRLTGAGLPDHALELWFERIVRNGMALTLAGDYAPFPEIAADVLRTFGLIDDHAIGHVMAGFGELPAQPDAEPALRTLREAGLEVACLSNGPAASTANFLAGAGLDSYVGQVLSVEDVRRWKPAGDVYAYALRELGRPAEDVALIAVHAWDCHGAARAGLTTGWASRQERHFPGIYQRPDALGDDLVEVVQGLLALPGG